MQSSGGQVKGGAGCCCCRVVVFVLLLLLLFLYCIELYAWALMQCSRDLLEGVAGVEAALK